MSNSVYNLLDNRWTNVGSREVICLYRTNALHYTDDQNLRVEYTQYMTTLYLFGLWFYYRGDITQFLCNKTVAQNFLIQCRVIHILCMLDNFSFFFFFFVGLF